MNIRQLKADIINKSVTHQPLIFIYQDNTFIANQYINEISNVLNYPIVYIDSIDNISTNTGLFQIKEDRIQVLHCKEFEDKNRKLNKLEYAYIVCSSIDKELKQEYENYIVNIPKLEKWQIQDYVYSICSGIQESKLNELIDICNNDIYRIDNELKKFAVFQESEQKYIYEQAISDGITNDISKYSIFNLSNCLVKKDIVNMLDIYRQLDSFDSQGVGILTILLNNFRNIVKIQLGNNPTPQSCNIPEKQFYAIKKNCGHYTKDQLLKIFEFLTSIDQKIRDGVITSDILLDYLITQILCIN